MFEAKVVAAAEAAADPAETNWKHKVTPDRGDLTLKGPIPYIYGTQVWLSLCLQMS